MGKKYTYEEVKKYIESHSLILNSKEYVNGSTKLIISCNDGHSFERSFYDFNSTPYCSFCKGTYLSHTTETIREYLYEYGITLLSDNYINTKQKLKLKCKCGIIYHKTFSNIKSEIKSPYCTKCSASERVESWKKDLNEIKEFLMKEDIELLTTEYKNARQKLKLKCPCEHIFERSWNEITNGYRCQKCSERRRYTFDEVKDFIESKSYKLLSNTYIDTTGCLLIRCDNGHEYQTTFHSFYYQGSRCLNCFRENNFGKNHWNWQGGITTLSNYLRDKITCWKKDSMMNSNYKCVITGEKFDDIHHLYSFNLIIYEVLESLNLPLYEIINEYNEKDLELLTNKVIELHYKYPLGVCLTEEVHRLFHNTYGYGNNIPEQFEEFKTRYKNGEFNDQLSTSA